MAEKTAEKTNKTSVDRRCYITGAPHTHTEPYYFGSEDHVVLYLSQEAFAHFVIRAGKDEMHRTIMRDLQENHSKIEAFSAEYPSAPRDTDQYIDAALQLAILADRKMVLLTQKCESGIRILRQMRSDFAKHGKLTS